MAKIELRDANIYLEDGLAGTAAVNNVAGYTAGATTMLIDSGAVNTTTPTIIPKGARFRVVGETSQAIHTVTSASSATTITFTPALSAGTVADNAVITILPQQLAIKVGDGNLTYTEAKTYNYELDRGDLDTVREGDAVPVAVNLQFVYEFVRTGTNEPITPSDALKGIGGASTWISAAADKCEPYAVDMVIEYTPVCSGTVVETERTVFEDFRHDTLAFDLSAASIAVTGRSNRTEATVTRI